MTKNSNVLQGIRDGKIAGHKFFLPAIYEHKAALINQKPIDVCNSSDLLFAACKAELDTYALPGLVTGVDIYNIEPEALGCSIKCSPDSYEVPVIENFRPDLLQTAETADIPDPSKDGRMPLMIEVARCAMQEFGSRTMVQAPISAPFTMAAELLGLENLIFAMFDEPDKVGKVLDLCLATAQRYAVALLETGAQIAIFDSRASCSIISPSQYVEFVAPLHTKLINTIREHGGQFTSLIIGGNTTPVLEHLFSAKPDMIVADFNVDATLFLTMAANHNTMVKVNANPAIFESDTDWQEPLRALCVTLKKYPRAIVSTGIIPYGIPSHRLLAAREAIGSAI